MDRVPAADQDFHFNVPLEIVKAADGKMAIRGFVTTEHRDREGEVILQDGLDFSEFKQWGYFNDNHSKSTADVLGWPVSVRKATTPDGRKGHWVEGELIQGDATAERIYKKAKALKESKAPRSLGFSVEGKIQSRTGHDGKTIAKAKVRNVAITAAPVNPYAGMDVVMKSLTAGTAVAAPPTAPGDAFPLRGESLEGDPSYATPKPRKKRKKKKRGEAMDKAEALEMIAHRGYTGPAAERVLRLARHMGD